MVKNIIAILSSVVLLMIIGSSVLQFHHHDCDGNVCMALHSFHCCDDDAQNHKSHNQEHGPNEDKEQCSLRIDDFQVTKQSVLDDTPPLLLSLFYGIIDFKEALLIIKENHCDLNCIKDDALILLQYQEYQILRAPPFYC